MEHRLKIVFLTKPLIIFLVLTGSLMVEAPALADSVFDGFYAGVNVGEKATQASVSSTSLRHNTDAIVAFRFDDDFNSVFSTLAQQQSLMGVFHLGYGRSLSGLPLYFGVEPFGSYAQRKPEVTQGYSAVNPPRDNVSGSRGTGNTFIGTTTTTAKLSTFEYGVDFKPALLLTTYTLLYGRVGLAVTQADLTTADSVVVFPNVQGLPTVTSTTTVTNSKNFTGLRLGFGLERYITQHFSVSMDYIYTKYGTVNAGGATTTHASGQTTSGDSGTITITNSNQSSVDLTSQTLLVGANYYFAGGGTDSAALIDTMVDRQTAASQVNGFYAGIRGGYEGTTAATKVNAQALIPGQRFTDLTQTNVPLAFSQSSDLWKNSATGGVFLGFGGLWPNSSFYFGGELFADAASHQMATNNAVTNGSKYTNVPINQYGQSIKNLSTTTTVNFNSPEFGLDLRPGLMIGTNTLLYLRAGIALNKANMTSTTTESSNDVITDSGAIVSAANSVKTSMTQTENKNLPGWRAGIGLEQYLGHSFSFNVDYIYTYYGNVSINAAGNSIGFLNQSVPFQLLIPTVVPNGLTNQTSATISTQAITLGLTWHFANPWR